MNKKLIIIFIYFLNIVSGLYCNQVNFLSIQNIRNNIEEEVCAWPTENDINGIMYICDNNLSKRVNIVDPVTKWTPLQYMVKKYQKFRKSVINSCFVGLVSLGANILDNGEQNWSPLYYLVNNKEWKIVNLILSNFKNIKVDDSIIEKMLSIDKAIKFGYENIVQFWTKQINYEFQEIQDLAYYARSVYFEYRKHKEDYDFDQNLLISYISIYSYLLNYNNNRFIYIYNSNKEHCDIYKKYDQIVYQIYLEILRSLLLNS
ncbi:MAG: hypothetical protein SZ59_C0002G0243 [candidate division TM6 bacterium GW2011_GWF2_28_16]|nr:MAG: hypothetical protein SZ59_C0002G0243 [candidate division TM6 bacterium GW2011_GWF2_28_16]